MSTQTGNLNATYKIAYPAGIVDLLPPTGKIGQIVDFVPNQLMNGKYYEQPVTLTREQGFTYSLDTQTAYALNDSVGMEMQSAQVPGADIVLNSTVGYNQAARASHSATSFKNVMSLKFENMMESSELRLEVAYLYGNDSIGQAAQQSVATTDPLAIVLSTAAWATGIWSGSENANIVFSRVSNGAIVDSLNSFQVQKVDVDAKTIYVTAGTAGTPGSLANLETAVEAYAVNIHFYGSVSNNSGTIAYNEMAGLKKILTNTGSLFGIDAGTYDLWRGNSVVVTGQLTMQKVLSAVAKAVQRGLNEKVTLMCNPQTWADLASNLAALRRFDGSYSKKKSENGSEELEYTSQNGTIKIVSYNIVKEGDCFIFPEDRTIRIGARELGLNDPTRPEEEIFFTIPGYAGVGLRAYTNQAIFLETPARGVYISGIVNSN